MNENASSLARILSLA